MEKRKLPAQLWRGGPAVFCHVEHEKGYGPVGYRHDNPAVGWTPYTDQGVKNPVFKHLWEAKDWLRERYHISGWTTESYSRNGGPYKQHYAVPAEVPDDPPRSAEYAGLWGAIMADPYDDTLRLAFADLLDEEGDPERAEFVRVQIAHAAAPDPVPYCVVDSMACLEVRTQAASGDGLLWCPDCRAAFDRRADLFRRAKELLTPANAFYWGPSWTLWRGGHSSRVSTEQMFSGFGGTVCRYERGFVGTIRTSANKVFDVLSPVTGAHPITEIHSGIAPHAANRRSPHGRHSFTHRHEQTPRAGESWHNYVGELPPAVVPFMGEPSYQLRSTEGADVRDVWAFDSGREAADHLSLALVNLGRSMNGLGPLAPRRPAKGV